MNDKHTNGLIKLLLSPEEKRIVDLISSAIIKKTFSEKGDQLKYNDEVRSGNGKIPGKDDIAARLRVDTCCTEKLIVN